MGIFEITLITIETSKITPITIENSMIIGIDGTSAIIGTSDIVGNVEESLRNLKHEKKLA